MDDGYPDSYQEASNAIEPFWFQGKGTFCVSIYSHMGLRTITFISGDDLASTSKISKPDAPYCS